MKELIELNKYKWNYMNLTRTWIDMNIQTKNMKPLVGGRVMTILKRFKISDLSF